MAKKIRYSQPLAELWDSYNKSNKSNNLSPKEFIHKWIDTWFKVAAVLPIAKEAETLEEFVESTAAKKEEKLLKVKVRKTKVLKDDAESDAPDVKA